MTRRPLIHEERRSVKVDDNAFRFDFPNGTGVVDKVKGVLYAIGVEGT